MLKLSTPGGLRHSFVVLVILGAIAVAIVPVAIATLVAEQRAEQKEYDALNLYAQRGLARVEVVFDNARKALVQMDGLTSEPCSDEYLFDMRRIAINHRYVRDIMDLDKKRGVECSAMLGHLQHEVILGPETWKGTRYRVWLQAKDLERTGNPMMVVATEKTAILIDPESLVDVISDYADLSLGVVNRDGTEVVAAWRNANHVYLLRAFSHPSTNLEDGNYYVVAKSSVLPIAVVAGEPSVNLLRHWYGTLTIWLPVGVACGLLAAAILLWIVRRRFSLPGQLRDAIRRKQLQVHYQPIIELGTGRCIGAEALVRWRQAGGNLVRPDLFVPVAEESGLIQPMTDEILEIICAEMATLLQTRTDLYISINLAAIDLASTRFLELLTPKLAAFEIDPAQICIEATERGFMHAETARSVIQAFRDAGHQVFIDDFGTGYSGLSYLQSFQVDALKIDKSFIDTVGTEAVSASVAPHIVEIGRSLNLKLVAEGIETQAQADWLALRGVQYGQGWLFARALPATEFLAFLGREKTMATPGDARVTPET
ncbi:EAL domain-containing protein [Silvimonas sp.]|uniref:EAL domain-containing protein n=1 Tax=Silvimonas sp. TaxID=2650811 RepID=UPI00283BF7B0|nr:EAL domain-containing protein [Silvimonas sp.]MDR3428691.1 EAL domain-containing protein [Silvimonas sp.]